MLLRKSWSGVGQLMVLLVAVIAIVITADQPAKYRGWSVAPGRKRLRSIWPGCCVIAAVRMTRNGALAGMLDWCPDGDRMAKMVAGLVCMKWYRASCSRQWRYSVQFNGQKAFNPCSRTLRMEAAEMANPGCIINRTCGRLSSSCFK